jgi:superfamily II DNA or RNA helicase
MFIYLATAPIYFALYIVKIGLTGNPHGRLSTYLTGCPPGLTPSHDIQFHFLWETTATTVEELQDYEAEAHDFLFAERMMRIKSGDSEWFNLKTAAAVERFRQFIESRPWFKRTVPLTEVIRPATSQSLIRPYNRNLRFFKRSLEERRVALAAIQGPWIAALSAFLSDSSQIAGKIECPCSSGKTRTTCVAINGLIGRLILSAPSETILLQWRQTLLDHGGFTEADILLIGSSTGGTTDPALIHRHASRATFCFLVTNMSAHLLIDHIASAQLYASDEAHHMAGAIRSGSDEEGAGQTRRLLAKAVALGTKRLFLTFTPRDVISADGATSVFSMNDPAVFGTTIYTIGLRTLIRAGVLPAYNIWPIYDADNHGTGMIAMGKLLSTAWAATEIVRGSERHVFNRMIVYAADKADGGELAAYLSASEPDTCVQFIQGGDDVKAAIARFEAAPRAILINCKVLGEGVDIPCADSVAITYPKYARGEIVQMLLRPGRWFPGKSVFHILLPTLTGQDMSGFNDVLAGLASVDDALRDEILHRTVGPELRTPASSTDSTEGEDQDPSSIQWHCYEGLDPDQITAAFSRLRRSLLTTRGSLRLLQSHCHDLGITTSLEYAHVYAKNGWPEDPRVADMTWYDFLHADDPATERSIPADFVTKKLIPGGLVTAAVYVAAAAHDGPSLQHINDGYFGSKYTNFTTLIDAFSPAQRGRRR